MVSTVGAITSFVDCFISGTVIPLYHQRGFFSQFVGGERPMKTVYGSGQGLILSGLPLTSSLKSPFIIFISWYFDDYFLHKELNKATDCG